jgi:G:T-mismatch repair DNA endonuclease (very short patch repair protein)
MHGNAGKPKSEEWKAKVRETRKRQWADPNSKYNDPTIRNKIRETVLTNYERDPSIKEKIREASLKQLHNKHTQETKDFLRKVLTGRTVPLERRAKISATLKEKNKDPAFKERVQTAAAIGRQKWAKMYTSKLERQYALDLYNSGKQVIFQPNLPGYPDIYLPVENMAIFIDGCYWHCCPLHFPQNTKKFPIRRARDARNSNRLTRSGILVQRIWEHTLHAENS